VEKERERGGPLLEMYCSAWLSIPAGAGVGHAQ
jgi:hypothetical protein